MLLEFVLRRLALEVCLEASVAMVKGFEKLERYRMGHDMKSFFSQSKDCW